MTEHEIFKRLEEINEELDQLNDNNRNSIQQISEQLDDLRPAPEGSLRELMQVSHRFELIREHIALARSLLTAPAKTH